MEKGYTAEKLNNLLFCFENEDFDKSERMKRQMKKELDDLSIETINIINEYINDKWDNINTIRCYKLLKTRFENFINQNKKTQCLFCMFQSRKNEIHTVDEILRIIMSNNLKFELVEEMGKIEIGDYILGYSKNRPRIGKAIIKRKCKADNWAIKIENIIDKKIYTISGMYHMSYVVRNNEFENPNDILIEWIKEEFY
jgi:hypothetical protein